MKALMVVLLLMFASCWDEAALEKALKEAPAKCKITCNELDKDWEYSFWEGCTCKGSIK